MERSSADLLNTRLAWGFSLFIVVALGLRAVYCTPPLPPPATPAADAGGEQGVLAELEALVLADLSSILTTLVDTGQLPQKHPSLLPAARAMRASAAH